MYFPADKVYAACRGDLDDPEFRAVALRELIDGAPHDKDYPDMLKAWLQELPPAEEQLKIARRLTEIAEAANCAISGFRWWDIVPHDRILLADLVRDGSPLTTMFYWRRTDKSLHPSLLYTPSPTVLRERGLVRVTFEAPTYQEVKAQFTAWLTQPFAAHGGR